MFRIAPCRLLTVLALALGLVLVSPAAAAGKPHKRGAAAPAAAPLDFGGAADPDGRS